MSLNNEESSYDTRSARRLRKETGSATPSPVAGTSNKTLGNVAKLQDIDATGSYFDTANLPNSPEQVAREIQRMQREVSMLSDSISELQKSSSEINSIQGNETMVNFAQGEQERNLTSYVNPSTRNEMEPEIKPNSAKFDSSMGNQWIFGLTDEELGEIHGIKRKEMGKGPIPITNSTRRFVRYDLERLLSLKGDIPRGNERETVVVQNRNVMSSELPRSLRDPKIDFEFSGKGDVDAFLLRIEASCAFVSQDYWASYAVRALTGSALSATQAQFPRPLEVPWHDISAFLRDRFRHPHFALMQVRNLIGIKQKAKATTFFQLVDQKISQIGLPMGASNAHVDKMIVGMLTLAIKPDVYEKLRADPDKFNFPSYTYAQFKQDVIAIDSALHSDKEGSGFVHRVATTTHSGVARRPAYSHPMDYKGDTTCRYCKSNDHLAPLCSTLYRKLNNGDSMPADLKQQNAKALKK